MFLFSFSEREDKKTIARHICDRNKESKTIDVLILTYMRSGSTFTADILQQAPDVFYVYEPFKAVAMDGFFRPNLFCSTLTGFCR